MTNAKIKGIIRKHLCELKSRSLIEGSALCLAENRLARFVFVIISLNYKFGHMTL